MELVATWQTIKQNLRGAVAPAKILSEQTKTTSMLRDLLNEDFNKIVINDRNIFNDTKSYIQRIAPDKIGHRVVLSQRQSHFRSI